MQIFIGADHRGFALKEMVKNFLQEQGYTVEDCGALELLPGDDFDEYARLVAEKVAHTPESRGIVLCGSGVGVDIVANKREGIRAGLGFNATQVKEARQDDDMNVLALASDVTTESSAKELVDIFLNTKYIQSEKHDRRVEKMEA